MLTLSTRKQLIIGLTLAVLFAITRTNHFSSLAYLPSASWAVFFLAGVYVRSVWAFPALMLGAVALDAIAVGWLGVSDYCVSAAYVMLVPAYASLWLAGRWYAARHSGNFVTLGALAIASLVGTAVCELISSGSFYFLSGRFNDPTIAEFGARLVKYFPSSLQSLAFWVGVAALIHVMCMLVTGRAGNNQRKSAI